MCFFFFNPGPVWRVPIPNRYTAKAKLCFCKNNKRTIIILAAPVQHHDVDACVNPWKKKIITTALTSVKKPTVALVSRPRPCGDGAPQTDHNIWEIWATGASHAGVSSSPGHSTAVVQRDYWGPPMHNWDSVAGPGRTPIPGNNSGRSQPGNSVVPSTVGRLGVDGFWIGDYGGGGPGRPLCWRTLEESCEGLHSVSLKINNSQPTYTPGGPGRLRSWTGPVETDFQGRLRFNYDGRPTDNYPF
jgi:hypothetical protein